MATRFEMVLFGPDPVSLRGAGEEALDEVDRLEAQLSLFKATSEIAHLNARAAFEPVRVTPAVFALLQHARQLTRETGGAFDITVAPLVRCWGFMAGSGRVPTPEELARARATVGMHLVHLDPGTRSVIFERPGVMVDLGAIGKGYAIERAVELLREAGIVSAFLHGGTSTLYGLGHPPDAQAWKVEIPDPFGLPGGSTPAPPVAIFAPSEPGSSPIEKGPGAHPRTPFATVSLCDTSLSVSAVWGKSFQAQGKTFGHILDPRTGEPAEAARLAAVVAPSATETDALSTALLTLGPAGHDSIAKLRPAIRTLVAGHGEGRFRVAFQGISVM